MTVPTITRRAEITARVFFSAVATACIVTAAALLIKGISTGTDFGALLLLLSFALIMLQDAWARRLEPFAIAAASPRSERDERRRMLAAKAKAAAGTSAILMALLTFYGITFIPVLAERVQALDAVQAVQVVTGVMAFTYFVTRLTTAWILNRSE